VLFGFGFLVLGFWVLGFGIWVLGFVFGFWVFVFGFLRFMFEVLWFVFCVLCCGSQVQGLGGCRVTSRGREDCLGFRVQGSGFRS